MPPRIFIAAAIILGIGVGCGAVVFGTMLAIHIPEKPATIVAAGSAILTASLAALVAYRAGTFNHLDDHDQ